MTTEPSSDASPESNEALSWVKPYYTRAGEYWGPPGYSQDFFDRLAAMERLCGTGAKRVLELGAGTGEAAAVMADAGHSVLALEFSPTRIPSIVALADQPRRGSLEALGADFYSVSLPCEFDVVCYWDGFGVGSDSDQRRLLKRIASEWLKTEGTVLIDVFSPYKWIRETEKEWVLERNHSSHRFRQRRRFNFDPVNGRFRDTWCPIDDETGVCDETLAITQNIRCYNPADFELLLEGTGLTLESTHIDGEPFHFRSLEAASDHPLWSAWSYLAKLRLSE